MITEESLWEDSGERFGISPVRPEYFKEEKENKMEKMMSENVNELFSALAKAQGDLTPALKGETNNFYKSKYADLASVVEAGREALSKNGLAISQAPCQIDGKPILVSILGHSSGQWIKSEIPLLMAKQDPQTLAAACTYAKRMAWAALSGIATTEFDDDGEKVQQEFREAEKASKEELVTTDVFWEALPTNYDQKQVLAFIKFRASRGKFSETQVMISAVAAMDKFIKSYEKWIAEKEAS